MSRNLEFRRQAKTLSFKTSENFKRTLHKETCSPRMQPMSFDLRAQKCKSLSFHVFKPRFNLQRFPGSLGFR